MTSEPPPPSQPGPPPYPAQYPPQYPGYQPPAPTNTLAIVSLITAFLCGPAGFVIGIIALRQTKRTGEGGSALAIAGIVVGAVQLVALLLVIIVFALGAVVSDQFGTTCSEIQTNGTTVSSSC
jgi:peptidyl-prolyl cis-trans isomerase B (cyclophilin B)